MTGEQQWDVSWSGLVVLLLLTLAATGRGETGSDEEKRSRGPAPEASLNYVEAVRNASKTSAKRTYGVEKEVRPAWGLFDPEPLAIALAYLANRKSTETRSQNFRWIPNLMQQRLYRAIRERPNAHIYPLPRRTKWALRRAGPVQPKEDGTLGWNRTDFLVLNPDTQFGFTLETDPLVVEMPTLPFTFEALKANEDWVRQFYFEEPARLGLHPPALFQADHVHTGINGFGGDPLHFLNFIIDYANHMELSMGAFGFNLHGAIPPLMANRDRDQFQRILQDFDQGKLPSIEAIQKRLKEVGFTKVAGRPGKPALVTETPYETIENRAVRAFRTSEHLMLWFELNELRHEYLRDRPGRVDFLGTGPIRSFQQGVNQFHRYVTEAGGDYDRFKVLLPPAWQRIPPTNAPVFAVNSNEFVERGYRCRLIFSDL